MSLAPPGGHPDPIDVDKIICERLRARRLIMGISQADLAKCTGISAQQIHKYETGVSRMTAGRLTQFASALKVPIAYFYDGVETNQKTPQRLINLLADPSSIEVLQQFWRIPKPLRLATLAYLRVLATETAVGDAAQHQTLAATSLSAEHTFENSTEAS